MKTTEFEEKVAALSSGYSVRKLTNGLVVTYKEKIILSISSTRQYDYLVFFNDYKDSLPFSHKLYMLAAEYSMTPIKDRETKYGLYNPITKDWLYDGELSQELGKGPITSSLSSIGGSKPVALGESSLLAMKSLLNYEKREIE